MGQLFIEGEGHDRMHQACAAGGMSPSMVKALIHLSPDHARPMRDLAEHWGCDASYITGLVDRLEEQGLAERRAHPTDRRVKTVVLTEQGVEAKQRVLDILWEPPAAFAALTAAEQRQLRDLLRKVAAADHSLATQESATA
jgi:DNA-binding MarR family transcriptional regulator